MKRGLIAVILLALIVTTAAISSVVLTKRLDTLSSLAENALGSEENAKKLEDGWEKNRVLFSVFIGHNHFEQLNADACALKYLEGEEYRTVCADIIVRLDELKDHVSFSIGNLF